MIIPLENKYYKWYVNICQQAKLRIWTRKTAPCYVEKHHINPRCLGGNNTKENLVFLTYKEHFICHLLLTKCYDGIAKSKMHFALWKMLKGNHYMDRNLSSKKLEIYRLLYIKNLKGRTFSPQTRLKISLALTGKSKTPEHIKIMKQYKATNQTKEKIRQARIGKHLSIETKEKLKMIFTGNTNPMFGKNHSLQTIEKMSLTYIITNPFGDIFHITNLRQFCITNNLNNGAMCRVAKGQLNHYKKWKCQYTH